MTVHRFVALVSATTLVGLLGVAQASNFATPTKREAAAATSLREKVRNADVRGCG